MNLLSILDVSKSQLENLSKNNLNRIGNGNFENYGFSFYPWIPSGVVKLEPNTGEAFTGENSIRFYPKEGEIGKITQRTRLLQVGEVYVLLFAARSLGSPSDLYVEFGRRLVRVSKESLGPQYSYYTFLFRSRSTFSYLHFFVKGKENENMMIDVDTVSLHSFLQLQKTVSFAV